MNRRLGTIAAWGGMAAAVILIATGWLVTRARLGAHEREAARHGAIASGLFDAIEGELSDLVAKEERRSFLEYRNVYVPDNSTRGHAGLVLSDLAALPADPAWVGYFQIGPSGIVSNPAIPLGNEIEAARSAGWQPASDLEIRTTTVQQVVSMVHPWDAVPPPVPLAPNLVHEHKVQPRFVLNRGASKRTNRHSQQKKTQFLSVETFHNTQQDVAVQVRDEGTRSGPTRDVDVRISPMAGHRVGDHLVLHRDVVVGSDPIRQGLVLDVDKLSNRLESTVLHDSDLEPYVGLYWDGDLPPSDTGSHHFAHQFAPPFESLGVHAALARIPQATSHEGWTLTALAALVAAVVLLGGFGLYRSVQAEIALAQRRSDFAAAVTHELKTPLTTIRLYAEMLRDGLVPGTDRQREYHATIVGESERLTRLVGNVLQLARLERGSEVPDVGSLDLGDLLYEVAELVAPVVRAGDAELTIEIPEDLPRVDGDRDGLVQAMTNLIDNAVKFSSSAADRRIEVVARHAEGRVTVAVADRGPGVPRSQLEHIFEPFFRGERALTRQTRGTGIGLALVHGTLAGIGGTVSARNRTGGGLEVCLALPVATP